MTSERIKEIQEQTAYPESVSVQQALLQVWNECEQEQLALTDVSQQRELLLAYEKYTSQQVIGKENSRMAKSLVENFIKVRCVTP